MSSGSGSGPGIGGLFFTTMVVVIGVAVVGWMGGSYYYGQKRLEIKDKLLSAADWRPSRVARPDATGECSAAKYREEGEQLLSKIGRFEIGKIEAFQNAPSAQRSREMSRTLRQLDSATGAFLQAYDCSELGRLTRPALEQQYSGPVLTKAIGVRLWTDPSVASDLRKAAWVGRDVQASGGMFEFVEGARIMGAAYTYLAQRMPEGELDSQLDALMGDLKRLTQNEESAQHHWRAGARILLADLLGPDWDARPPNPVRAKTMIDSMDRIIESLEQMPELAESSFPIRQLTMQQWVEKEDMGAWDPKFAGFGETGLAADIEATRVHAQGRALLIAAAIRKYRRGRGYCPSGLDDLARAEILDTVPSDPFTDKPFVYDRGTCTITSAAVEGAKPVVMRATPG